MIIGTPFDANRRSVPSRTRFGAWEGELMGSEGREAIGYDYGYDGEVFYLGLALDPAYIADWVEGCLERIGKDNPEKEQVFRDLSEDETQRDVVLEALQADCEVRRGRPIG